MVRAGDVFNGFPVGQAVLCRPVFMGIVMKKVILFGALIVGAPSVLAGALEESADIILRPTRTADYVDNTTSPVTIVDEKALRTQPLTDAASIIEQNTSAHVARSGGAGALASVFLRGTNSNHTVVLIDGIKVNSPVFGTAAVQNIDPSMLDRVEIIKGPRSTTYGSEAIGGVISMTTRRNWNGTSGYVDAAGMNDQELSAGVYHGKNGIRLGLNTSYHDTDGYRSSPSSDEKQGYDRSSYHVFAGSDFGLIDLEAGGWGSDGNVEYYSFGDLSQDYQEDLAYVKGTIDWDYWISTSLRWSQAGTSIDQDQPNFLGSYDYLEADRDEFNISTRVDYQTHSFALGYNFTEDNVESVSFGIFYDESDTDEAYYGQANLRWDRFSTLLAYRQSDYEDFDSQDTWNIEFAYRFSDQLRAFAGIGTAFRAPTSTDKYGFAGNPALKPERSRSAESGLIWSADNTMVSASYFHTRIDDLIQINSGFTLVENIAEADIEGIELESQYRKGQWILTANFLWQNAVDEILDEKLSRRPDAVLSGYVSYLTDRHEVTVGARNVSSNDDSSFSMLKNDSYMVFDARVAFNARDNILLYVQGNNIFGEDYQTAAGFNAPDRTIKLGIKVSL